MSALDIVLIHLGSRAPGYLHTCASQVRAVSGRAPVYVGPKEAAALDGRKLREFRTAEHLSDYGLSGFWRYTCERFFILEEHMRASGLRRCIHIESDNLLYAAPASYSDWLSTTYGDQVAVCPLTDDLDTAAFLYVGSVDALARLNAGLLELVAMTPEQFLTEHGGEMAHEMRMLRVLRERGLSAPLPIFPDEAQSTGSGHVFDAGPYGQIVDGWYWNPGVPYIDEGHLLGPALAEQRLRVVWGAGRDIPFALAPGGNPQPIVNLHMHSKRLTLWATQRVRVPRKPAGIPGEATLASRARRGRDATLATASRIRRGRWRWREI
jgi:hypothetical protein